MNEIVVISGKGGTGKTSLTASFATLAARPVIADCDVDGSDLHLVLSPRLVERHDFHAGHEALIRPDACDGCGVCLAHCRFGAIIPPAAAAGRAVYACDPLACEGCGVCVRVCPRSAIDLVERRCGEWMVSETRCGPLVHARLRPGAENSGKLVTTVRREARRQAEAGGHDLILVDGPPGIGCPVIASLTGATRVVIVTEPTVSGEHDLRRVLALARHFGLPAAVCVNKWDLAPDMAARLAELAQQAGALDAGRVRYDQAVTRAQMREQTVVETAAASAADIGEAWERIVAWTQIDSTQSRNPRRSAS